MVGAVQNSTEDPFTRWSDLAQKLLGRVGKQVRDPPVNHLNPVINHLPFSREDVSRYSLSVLEFFLVRVVMFIHTCSLSSITLHHTITGSPTMGRPPRPRKTMGRNQLKILQRNRL